MTTETLTFAAETKELLGLMIHSLYERREIFLRELVSNASDALDKLRFEALTEPGLTGPDDRLAIRLETDRDARTLAVIDNGIGMSRDELVANLGTIASSGTKQFLRRARDEGGEKEAAAALPELIGQFGVGFYSSFIVADLVTVETRRAGEAGGWRWTSRGEGEYTIEAADGLPRGTRVTLHLRDASAKDADGDEQDFLDPHVLQDVVRRYSDFVEYPIEMELPDGDEGGTETRTLNSMKPLWARPKEDVTEEQYGEFYRHLTHDWEAPLETIHFKAEGTLEYTALLFLPAHRPLDLFEESRGRSRLSLYVRRVLIEAECEELLPPWLRFVRGVVDSPDLPLNVSRDVLQQNAQVRAIRKRLVRKLLHALGEMLAEDRERYAKLWDAFGLILKEGIWLGEDEDGRISKVCLFHTTHGDEPSTLAEVAERTSGDTIFYLTGRDREMLRGSPLLEGARKRGQEVLLLTDPVDEWVVQRLTSFDRKKLAALDRGDAELGAAEKEALEQRERELRDVLSAVERALAGKVASVRLTARLDESPACLVTPEHGLSPNLERILRATNQEVPKTERILELNPDHPLVLKLAALQTKDPGSKRIGELAELIHAQALLAEGSPLADPARFSKLVSELVVAGLD